MNIMFAPEGKLNKWLVDDKSFTFVFELSDVYGTFNKEAN